MSHPSRASKLLSLVDLINKASQTILREWEKEEPLPLDASRTGYDPPLPTWELYNAQRTIVSACGAFAALVQNPQLRLLEISAGFFESRALHIAVEHRIPDILARTGLKEGGAHIEDLSTEIGIDPLKLGESF